MQFETTRGASAARMEAESWDERNASPYPVLLKIDEVERTIDDE